MKRATTIEKNHCRMLTEEEKAALRQDLKDTLAILKKLRDGYTQYGIYGSTSKEAASPHIANQEGN